METIDRLRKSDIIDCVILIFRYAPIASRKVRQVGPRDKQLVFFAPIAQLVEQLPFKQTVPGSSPGGRTP